MQYIKWMRNAMLTVVTVLMTVTATSCNLVGENRPGRNKINIPASDSILLVRIADSIPQQLVQYEGFIVNFNKQNHTPNYVSWELLAHETDGAESRSNNFWQDENVPGCATSDDYRRSGYDRGHMCPAADQKWSAKAMEDCFVMANMCPQANALNSGAWNTLEKKERLWAQRDSVLVIIAGPIYESSDNMRFGQTGVRVPSAFFKVLLAPKANPARAIAFVYPNMKSPGNMANYSMSIDELEQITGYDFFYTLPQDVQQQIESSSSFRLWDKR